MEEKDIISSGLLELHVLGLTTAAESEQVLKWRASSLGARAELDEIERTMEAYAMMHAVKPRESLRTTVLAQVPPSFVRENSYNDSVSTSGKVVSISPFWKYAAAASIVLLVGSAILNFVYYNKYQQAELSYNESQKELLAVNDRVRTLDGDMTIVRNKYSQSVSLNGLPAAPGAAAKVFWMKNSGDIYIDPSNLPEAPEGKQYQLWGIIDGKPVDAGMIIQGKDNQYRIQKMKTFGNVKVQAFAVTLEPTGGNPTPKGDMYVMGEM